MVGLLAAKLTNKNFDIWNIALQFVQSKPLFSGLVQVQITWNLLTWHRMTQVDSANHKKLLSEPQA